MAKDPTINRLTPTANTELMAVEGPLYAKLLLSDLEAYLGTGVVGSYTVTAGAGLTGGGAINTNPTINVASTSGSITVGADTIDTTFGITAVQLTDSTTGTDGVAASSSRSDHRHGLPAHLTSSALAAAYAAIGTQIIAGAGLTGGGTLAADRTLNVASTSGSLTVGADTVDVTFGSSAVQLTDSTTGTAGVAASASRSDHRHGLAAHLTASALNAAYVPVARTVTAGNGLTGGGALSADITLNVASSTGSITVSADSIDASLDTILLNGGDNVVTMTEAKRIQLSDGGTAGTGDVPILSIARTATTTGTALGVSAAGTDEAVRIVHSGTSSIALYLEASISGIAARIGNGSDATKYTDYVYNAIRAYGENNFTIAGADSSTTQGWNTIIAGGDSTHASSNGGGVSIRAGAPGSGGTRGGVTLDTLNTAGISPNQITLQAGADVMFYANGSNAIPLNNSSTYKNLPSGVSSVVEGLSSSGTWTPSFSNLANLTSVTLVYAKYTQTNGYVDIDLIVDELTSGATTSRTFEFTLPVNPASNFSTGNEGGGVGTTNTANADLARFFPVTAAKRMKAAFTYATGAVTVRAYYKGSYPL